MIREPRLLLLNCRKQAITLITIEGVEEMGSHGIVRLPACKLGSNCGPEK